MRDIQDFDSLKIKLASPETIRSWSYGEVKKPETINYRTLRPEKEGLFCERIFGTTKEWECFCGKFKSIRYKGVVCDRCGVEVTHYRVRRERMGHIDLAAPVSHIWYYRSSPSRMGMLLDLKVGDLKKVLYYESYIVIDPGDVSDLKKMQLLTEDEYNEFHDRYGGSFTAGMGAEAIKTLLDGLDLDSLAKELREKMREKGEKADKGLLKRIQIVEDFRSSGNKCSWMILDVIPVIPPELRPMVQLDGGRFASSDLNDLYRRVINRNNRLKRLMTLGAPDIIIRNEKRMLQEAVDALFDNSKRKKLVKGPASRPLKSISDYLKGKNGRFRQNLLGKRVDYSGRSVIVVGPELKLWQCGLPTKMALELFKPFIMKRLEDEGVAANIKKAKEMVEAEQPEVFAILDKVVQEHPVMLNRAPTLHRLGIQAFEPVLVDGKAIKLHPLVCKAFNADFDGDQMAVHVPLTQAAQAECWSLMLSARNLLDPASGKTIVFPSQDMVLGIYYLTATKLTEAQAEAKKADPNFEFKVRRFSSENEVLMAAEYGGVGGIGWQELIEVPVNKAPYNGKVIRTTAGLLKFNNAMPAEVEYVNEQLDDSKLRSLIEKVHREMGAWLTVQMLDAIKAIGYESATFFGASISMKDIIVPEKKKNMLEEANKQVEKEEAAEKAGQSTTEERRKRVIALWGKVDKSLENELVKNLEKDQDGFNTIWMMANSGARGSRKQIKQLAGMRGLMNKSNGDVIELPIRSSFKEGLSVHEFFISSNGARKGLSDTALKTADAGYLTRRLVDVAQDVVVNEEDCGTINGIVYEAPKDDKSPSLGTKAVGYFTLERVLHPVTGELICDVNEYITEEIAKQIDEAGVESVKLRTVLTCDSRYGVCCKCYGRNLAHNKVVEIGEAVGIIAAQSIGQPGTQLTMRTFHTGGVASLAAQSDAIKLAYDALIIDIVGTYLEQDDSTLLFTRRGSIKVAKILNSFNIKDSDEVLVRDGDVVFCDTPLLESNGKNVLSTDRARVLIRGDKLYLTSVAEQKPVRVPNGSSVLVRVGESIDAGKPLAKLYSTTKEPMIAGVDGYVVFEDIISGVTMVNGVITDSHLDTKQPRIIIRDVDGNDLETHFLPADAKLEKDLEENMQVSAGYTLATIPLDSLKTIDITGDLPHVSELFEARNPKNATVLAQISGTVRFKEISKGKRLVVVYDKYGNEFKHYIPTNKQLLVRDGDEVEVGEKLCAGSVNPHDILAIQGEGVLQKYLMDEIQAVYTSSGITINDKHIAVIIRQMLRKVEVRAVGDTSFIFGQQVDKYKFKEENNRVIADGGQPAIAQPKFQAISKASLSVDSFISAASFQETTRVLTNAAISGAVDNLHGLKENVTIGHLIPAGTGAKSYRNVKLFDDNTPDLDAQMNEIMERHRLEKEQEEAMLQMSDISFDTEED